MHSVALRKKAEAEEYFQSEARGRLATTEHGCREHEARMHRTVRDMLSAQQRSYDQRLGLGRNQNRLLLSALHRERVEEDEASTAVDAAFAEEVIAVQGELLSSQTCRQSQEEQCDGLHNRIVDLRESEGSLHAEAARLRDGSLPHVRELLAHESEEVQHARRSSHCAHADWACSRLEMLADMEKAKDMLHLYQRKAGVLRHRIAAISQAPALQQDADTVRMSYPGSMQDADATEVDLFLAALESSASAMREGAGIPEELEAVRERIAKVRFLESRMAIDRCLLQESEEQLGRAESAIVSLQAQALDLERARTRSERECRRLMDLNNMKRPTPPDHAEPPTEEEPSPCAVVDEADELIEEACEKEEHAIAEMKERASELKAALQRVVRKNELLKGDAAFACDAEAALLGPDDAPPAAPPQDDSDGAHRDDAVPPGERPPREPGRPVHDDAAQLGRSDTARPSRVDIFMRPGRGDMPPPGGLGHTAHTEYIGGTLPGDTLQLGQSGVARLDGDGATWPSRNHGMRPDRSDFLRPDRSSSSLPGRDSAGHPDRHDPPPAEGEPEPAAEDPHGLAITGHAALGARSHSPLPRLASDRRTRGQRVVEARLRAQQEIRHEAAARTQARLQEVRRIMRQRDSALNPWLRDREAG